MGPMNLMQSITDWAEMLEVPGEIRNLYMQFKQIVQESYEANLYSFLRQFNSIFQVFVLSLDACRCIVSFQDQDVSKIVTSQLPKSSKARLFTVIARS